jgi:hypothetical protein
MTPKKNLAMSGAMQKLCDQRRQLLVNEEECAEPGNNIGRARSSDKSSKL